MCHALRVTEAGATPRIPVTPRASRGGVAPASSEFSRVLPVVLFTGYLFSFSRLRFTAGVKRTKTKG
jgi:hypothetical protein